jgi:hypothetical protein
MKLSEDELKSIWQQETLRGTDSHANCLSAELLVRAGEGKLDASERAQVAGHLAECAHCAEDYRIALSVNEWAAQSADHYASLFPQRIVPATPPNWRQRLTGELKRLRSSSPLAVAMTAVLLLISLMLGVWLLTLRQQNRILVAQLNQQRIEAVENAELIASVKEAALIARVEELERRQTELSMESAGQQTAGQEDLKAENVRLTRELDELSRPQLDLPQIDLDPKVATRAASGGSKDTVTTFNVPPSASSFTINLPGAGSKPSPHYLIELVDAKTNKVVWNGQRRQDKETTFTLTLAKRGIPAGQYRIRVYGLDGKGKQLLSNYDILIKYPTRAAQ